MSFLEIDSRVRCKSMHANGVITHTFSRGLQQTLRPLRRFEYEHGLTLFRDGFDDGTRSLAADFLVGIQKNNHRTVICTKARKRAQRIEHHDDPSFHVEYTGAEQPAVLHAKRHLRQGPHGPDSVKVSQKQYRFLGTGAGKASLQMIAGFGYVMEPDLALGSFEFIAQYAAKKIDGSFVVAGGFHLHQPSQGG